jgi:hypothetical protein
MKGTHRVHKFNYQITKMKLAFSLSSLANKITYTTLYAVVLVSSLVVSATAQAQEAKRSPDPLIASLTVKSTNQFPIEAIPSQAIAQREKLTNSTPDKKNDVGLAVQFGSGTNIGIQGKFGVAESFSLRPEFFFNSGGKIEAKQNTSLFLPFTSTTNLTSPVTVAGTFTTVTPFTTNIPVRTNVPGNVFGTTVVPNNTTIPAGTNIPVGSTIQAGQILPPGLQFPAGTSVPVVVPSGSTVVNNLSGTSFGLAATYDFKLDPQGKSVAYVGPKVSFASASGSASFAGADIPEARVNTSETKIGLVAGLDYGISDSFTIGANATYNFSRSTNTTGSFGGTSADISNVVQSGGSALDFGVRASYRF